MSLNDAYRAYQADDLQGAARILERLRELTPHDAEVLLRLGQVYFKLGRRRDAQGCFQEAVRLDPEQWSGPAWEGITECRLASDKNERTQTFLASCRAFLERATAEYERHGRLEDAERCRSRVPSIEDRTVVVAYGWVG